MAKIAKKTEENNIGIKVKKPERVCDDKNCPFHGALRIRGRTFVCTVRSHKMQKSVVVEWERKRLIPKYERYENRRTRVKAHIPPCIDAKEGDTVRIAECRPLSKLKSFVVIEKLTNKN